ncbi:hypothetical protein [Stenotrophomonas pigmentata]|uniref:hypothetical protein n=1 Tax=Stenotrophomonas pigmentata TaxID=3055080 RepID=UPI0026F27642|nr:hypothetical protein [Stenotrophomonas sp. 610A2]
MKRLSLLMVPLLLALAACKPQASDTERRPDPQATALRDAMKKDLDQAKATAAAAEQASKAQQAELDAAIGAADTAK